MIYTIATTVTFDASATGRINPDEINELAESLAIAILHTHISWDVEHQHFLITSRIEANSLPEAKKIHTGDITAALQRRHLAHLHIAGDAPMAIQHARRDSRSQIINTPPL